MMDDVSREQVATWAEAGEFGKVIEALEKIPLAERDFDTTGALARAYNNIEEYDKALSLLDRVQAEGTGHSSWNFRKGYALYYLERYEESLACFKKANELSPGDENTLDFIRECNIKMPFSKRVADFWRWFTAHEAELSHRVEARGQYTTDEIVEFVGRGINLISEDVHFNIGGDHEFTFSVEGNIALFYLYPYLIERMPERFKDKWTFFPFSQGSSQSFTFGMCGASIPMENVGVDASYHEESNNFSIRFYEPELCGLPDNQCYNAYYIMMGITLGEGLSYQYIGNVERAPAPLENMIPLTSLRDHIIEVLRTSGKEIFDNPQQVYSSYRLEPQESEELRYDVAVGTTCFEALVADYYNDSTDLFDRLNSLGAQAVYIAFSYDNEEEGDMNAAFKLRCEIEDALDKELLEPEGLGLLLGGATGQSNCYIDLLLFDAAAFAEKVIPFLKRYPHVRFYISDFRQHCDIYRLFEEEEE